MALSSISNNDILMSSIITGYAQGTSSEFMNYTKSSNVKKIKMTPKQCKPSHRSNADDKIDSKMKKSSSMHNIEKLNEDQQFPTAQNINTKNASYDKQINLNSELLSRIEREKKQYEAKISELIQNLEIRKKDNEILIYDKRNLTETVKLLQKEVKQLTSENMYWKHKLKDFGIDGGDYEFIEKQDEKQDSLNASGDTLIDAHSVAFATIGDSSSFCDHLSDDSPGNPSINDDLLSPGFYQATAERKILDSLSVSTLQDRIQKMEEDSYCTNEELQATIQELADLQKSLDHLHEENRCLGDDRAILLESLCEQTQKLQKCRLQIDNLKFLLLYTGSKDSALLESKLQELYRISEDENQALVTQNEECKQTIVSCQNEYTQLSATIEYLKDELDRQIQAHSALQDKYKEELWQREQVEALLKNHNELFRNSLGWGACSSGVLALIQQVKSMRQTELGLRVELMEKHDVIELLSGQISQLQSSQQGDERQVNIKKLQSQLKDYEQELRLSNQNLDLLSQTYAEDIMAWREYERDLLVAISAANSLKEEKENQLAELETRLDVSESSKKYLQEKNDAKTVCCAHMKDRSMALHERANLPNIVISKAPTSTASTTNNSVKTLIQSIEDQVKAVNSPTKLATQVPKASHNTNTVPRSNTFSKPEKTEIARTNTSRFKDESSPVIRRNSELTQVKPLPETISKPKIVNQLSSESPQPSTSSPRTTTSPPPLTTVVSQASTILQSVSRRTSVTSSALPADHIHHYSSSSSTLTASTNQSQAPPAQNNPDCLSQLVKLTNKGSKRNALLYWCQTKTAGYQKIDITNFSSSWNDGLALCALFHACDHKLLDFKKLVDAFSANPDKNQKRINFQTAFDVAKKIGMVSNQQLSIESMLVDRPDWNSIMGYVTDIYQHFERSSTNPSTAQ